MENRVERIDVVNVFVPSVTVESRVVTPVGATTAGKSLTGGPSVGIEPTSEGVGRSVPVEKTVVTTDSESVVDGPTDVLKVVRVVKGKIQLKEPD